MPIETISFGNIYIVKHTYFILCDKYGKSVAQVILRWLIQRGIVVFPKSTKESRMIENSDVFDFELSDEDMEKIKELETGIPIAPVNDPTFIKFVCGTLA